MQCPVLLISGRADELPPPATHLDNLARELRANGNRRVTALRPVGVNHLLQPPPWPGRCSTAACARCWRRP